MSENEKELFNIIHAHDNPEEAIEIAIKLMFDFSARHEAPQDTSAVHLPESA